MAKSILEEIAEENVARDIRLAEAIKPMLEPEVAEAYLTDAANLSLAISLKRIADIVTNPVIWDSLMMLAHPAVKVDRDADH